MPLMTTSVGAYVPGGGASPGTKFNGLTMGDGGSLTGEGLILTDSLGGFVNALSVEPITGKKYFELKMTSINAGSTQVGIGNTSTNMNALFGGSDPNNSEGVYNDADVWRGNTVVGGSAHGFSPVFGQIPVDGDIIRVAVDEPNGTIYVALNGDDWFNNPAIDAATNTGGITYLVPGTIYAAAGVGGGTITAVFSATDWTYSAPAGFTQIDGSVPNGILRTPTNMSSNTAPSPFVASATSEFAAPYEAWKVFDGNASTFWASGTGVLPQFIKIDLGTTQYCRKYTIKARPTTTFHYWINWVLEGSPDDSSWTTVDTQTGQSFTPSEQKIYTPGTPQQFRYWRWTVTSSQSGADAEATAIGIYS